MQYAAPGATAASRLVLGPENTGLAGTVRLRILDNDATADDPFYGPSAGSIIEDPTGSGSYVWHGTAPTTQGIYSLLWDTGPDTPLIPDEDLAVTRTATGPFTPSGNEYVTRDELKEILMLTGDTFADHAIDIAVESASRAIDGYKSDRFYPTVETRYYSPSRYDPYLTIDSLSALTQISVDVNGDGSYGTAWTNGGEFTLDPINAPADGAPYRRVMIRQQSGAVFPGYRNAVKITGTFGWTTTPTMVKQAAGLLANRFLNRQRSAPLGVMVAAASDMVATAHLGSLDKDAVALLDLIPGTRRPPLRSLRLG